MRSDGCKMASRRAAQAVRRRGRQPLLASTLPRRPARVALRREQTAVGFSRFREIELYRVRDLRLTLGRDSRADHLTRRAAAFVACGDSVSVLLGCGGFIRSSVRRSMSSLSRGTRTLTRSVSDCEMASPSVTSGRLRTVTRRCSLSPALGRATVALNSDPTQRTSGCRSLPRSRHCGAADATYLLDATQSRELAQPHDACRPRTAHQARWSRPGPRRTDSVPAQRVPSGIDHTPPSPRCQTECLSR